MQPMKSIFNRFFAGATGKAGEEVRKKIKKTPTRKRYAVRG
jgi:hypothetical protein